MILQTYIMHPRECTGTRDDRPGRYFVKAQADSKAQRWSRKRRTRSLGSEVAGLGANIDSSRLSQPGAIFGKEKVQINSRT
jgi:hypothetical protein